MDIKKSIEALIQKQEDGIVLEFDELLLTNLKNACKIIGISSEEIFSLETIKVINENISDSKESIRWMYVMLGFHLLMSINESNTNDDLIPTLSVKQVKNVRTILQMIISIGLVPNLLPGVGLNLTTRSKNAGHISYEPISVFEKYNRLKSATLGLLKCNEIIELKKLIISYHLGDLLAALLQLSFAPLKKPNSCSLSSVVLTEESYQLMLKDKVIFNVEFSTLLNNIYPPMVVKELMVLLGVTNPPAPNWLKRVVTKTLCDFLIRKDGVSSLVRAVIDTDNVDTGQHWQQLDVLVSLIINIGKQGIIEEYFFRISDQIVRVLSIIGNDTSKAHIYIVLSRLLMASLIEYNSEIFKNNIFDIITTELRKCSEDNTTDDVIVMEKNLNTSINIIYSCFVVELNTTSTLPTHFLIPFTRIFFRLYTQVFQTLTTLKDKIKEILEKILAECDDKTCVNILDCVLFDGESDNILKFSDYLEIVQNAETGSISIKGSGGVKMKFSVESMGNSFISFLMSCEHKFDCRIFMMLVEYLGFACIKIEKEYNVQNSNKDLLSLENEPLMFIDTFNERKYMIFKILEHLFTHGHIVEIIKDKPIHLIVIIKNFLKLFISSGKHNIVDYEPLLGVMLILEMVLDCGTLQKELLTELDSMIELLDKTLMETKNEELKLLLETCIRKIKNRDMFTKPFKILKEKTEFQEALDYICDPILPARAHGLIVLTQLIKRKDPETWARKQVVMCVFKDNLKNDDSFVYLSAINGIAELANVFTDMVIDYLIAEFVSSKENFLEEGQRVRMNIGEVLVKVTRALGDMAPKYKCPLIHAFLSGIKDPDNLIRASSLSNLGQLCQILGYKLGVMITEVLYCIHDVIKSDKSIEVRRAAVLVIRQLFTGLGAETIVFLKDSILSIYRTLKHLYSTVNDDVMKLHVQLALEELNSVTKEFLLVEESLEMKIRVLNIKDCDNL